MRHLLTLHTWSTEHAQTARRLALVTVDTLGMLALATLAPEAAWSVVTELGRELVTQPTYGLMSLACVAYAFAMAAARRWQSAIYERLLYAVVIGGVIIVGVSAFCRVVYFPIPMSEPRAVAWWALRIIAYHFTIAAFPIIIWQFGQEQYELREAAELRARAM